MCCHYYTQEQIQSREPVGEEPVGEGLGEELMGEGPVGRSQWRRGQAMEEPIRTKGDNRYE